MYYNFTGRFVPVFLAIFFHYLPRSPACGSGRAIIMNAAAEPPESNLKLLGNIKIGQPLERALLSGGASGVKALHLFQARFKRSSLAENSFQLLGAAVGQQNLFRADRCGRDRDGNRQAARQAVKIFS